MMFGEFKKGSGGTYKWDEKEKQLVKISDETHDPNYGLNGPVYCPDGGYFDKALQRRFETKAEKRAYMREHGLKMDGSDKNYKGVEAQGMGKTYYFIPGVRKKQKYYKYR